MSFIYGRNEFIKKKFSEGESIFLLKYNHSSQLSSQFSLKYLAFVVLQCEIILNFNKTMCYFSLSVGDDSVFIFGYSSDSRLQSKITLHQPGELVDNTCSENDAR